MKKKIRKTMSTILSLAMVLSLLNVRGLTSMAEETELTTEAVTEVTTEAYAEVDDETSADAYEAEDVYEGQEEEAWEGSMYEDSDYEAFSDSDESEETYEGQEEDIWEGPEYSDSDFNTLAGLLAEDEEEASDDEEEIEDAWDGYFTNEHPEWGGVMETYISDVEGYLIVNIPAGAFTEAVSLSADAQVYVSNAAYDSSFLSSVLAAAGKSFEEDTIYSFYTLNLTFYNEEGEVVYPNDTIYVYVDMGSTPVDLGAGFGNAAAIEEELYYANEETGAAERLWEAAIYVTEYNQISGLEFSAYQFSSPYVLLLTEPKEESIHTVTFDLDAGEGACVVLGETVLTETGTAEAENGTIVFSVLTDEDYDVDTVLVDGSIEARKNEATETDDDYIIEGIATDNTIVTVTTKEKNDDELVDQMLYATIFTDASYSMEAADSTSIILSGLMPKGAFVKAYSVDVEIEGVNVLAAYDISIFDADGDEFEPEGDSILVEISNAEIQEALDDDLELTVYHMEDEADEPEEIAEVSESAEIVIFSANQFSIYIVGTDGSLTDENGETVDAYTVCFYEWVYDEAELGEPEIAEEKVVGDDYLNEHEVPEVEHHVFDGWFTEEQDANHYGDGEYPGYKYDFSMTVQQNLDSWDGYEVGEGNVINLYSDYDPIYYVYYMTEEEFDDDGNKTNEDVVVFTDEYHENNSLLDTSNAESIYQQSHLGAEQAVTSWYYYDENNEKQTIVNGTEITDNLTLYPVVQDVIWVYFYLGEDAGENVEAVEPIYVPGDATEFGELPVPEMAGYDFAGWYFQAEDGEDVLVEATFNPQGFISEEKKDIGLYAHWEPAEVGYTVNIWRQKATDGQPGLDQKTVQNGEVYSTYINYYDYAESFTVPAQQSQLKTGDTPTTGTVYNWNTYTGYGWTTGNRGSDGTGDYVGFEYNQTRTENDLATATVKADGSTIINIFYDRVTVTYNFGTSSNSTRYGTLIGLYDTNTSPTNGSDPGGTLNGWPDPDNGYSWHYSVSGSASGNNMSFLAKFALTENSSNRSNVVNFTQNSTGYSATLYYYLEVTNPDRQVTADSKTITIDDTTYVLDRTVSFGISSRTGNTFNFTDKYIGYEYVGYNTDGGTTMQTPSSKSATVSNGGSLYIFNKALKYTINLYSNHNGEQLVWSDTYKYGAPLSSVEFPDELDAETYGPAYYYHFTGTWYEDPTFTAEFQKPETMPNYNLVAYADWELNEVEVTFQSNVESDLYDQLVECYGEENVTVVSAGDNGSWAYSVVITAGDELDYTLDIGFTAAEDETTHDYEYGGMLNTSTNKVFNFSSQIYTDTTLQLFWIEEQTVYHLQYNFNQGEGSTVTEVLGHGHESTSWAEVRELVDVFENVEDDEFICWNTMPDGSGTNFYPDDDVDFTKVVATPVYVKDDDGNDTDVVDYYVYNLYAIWAEEKTASLDLEYNYPEGYEAVVTNEIITGANLTEVDLSEYETTLKTITIDGVAYRFTGWAYSEDAKEADIPAGTTVAVDNVNEEGNVLYGVWLAVEPDWTVEKELTNSGSGEDGAFKAGETATFTITVTNIGDEVIELIEVTEALDGATFVESTDGSYTLNEDKTVATITDLAAGASVEIQATYTVTEEDIESEEELANSITTEGGDPDDPIPGPGDETPIPTEDLNPSLSVKKTADVNEGEEAVLGQEITYTIVVTNDGNVTLTDITVTDDLTGESWTIDSLAPEESATFTTTYVVTEDDIIAGSIENVATATAPNPNYDPENPDSPENIVGEGEEEVTTEDKNPHLTVTKEVNSEPDNGTTYALGEEITWEVTITNDGNLTITGITLTDELTGDSWTIESLAPGESATFETEPYTVKEADIIKGSVANVATATGTSPDPENPDTPVEPGTDEQPTDEENPHLTVSKVVKSTPANGTAYDLGEEIVWIITVTNDGNLTISDIVVTDELTGDTWTVEGTLAPGESSTFGAVHVVNEADIEAGDVYNEATATGKSPDPENPNTPVEPGDDDEPTVTPGPSLYVDKTADVEDGEEVVLGQEITYTIYVLNNGNVTLTGITVSDDLTGESWTIDSLAPGEDATFTTTYVVTEDDIIAGSIENVATATAPNPEYDPEDPESPENIEGEDEEEVKTEEGNPHLFITKEATSTPENGEYYTVGEEITWNVTITNDGNLTITDITVTDELTGDEWTIDSLAPGEDTTFETSPYTVTEDDIINGSVVNEATATGTTPDPENPDVPDEPGTDKQPTDEKNPHLTIAKEASSTPANGEAYALGEEITWDVTVTNDGNLTITDIVVKDELTGDTWEIESLAPGESETFEASYTVTETDLEAGSVVNEAEIESGTSPDPENPDVPSKPGSDDQPTEEPEEFFPLDEEIVPGSDDEASPDSWVKEESVNEYDAIEIEMSTTLPKMSGQKMVDEGYVLTFHNQLDDGLVLHSEEEFIIDINGQPISDAYYDVDTTKANRLVQFFSIADDCSFHVNVDLAALYADGVITDDYLEGDTTIRVFFYVDLEDVDEENIQNVYYSTAWYDITTESGETVHTSEVSTVDVYTYELIVEKYDSETNEPLADAVFGIYKDTAATNAVSRGDSDYTATTDENGQAIFIGIAADTYLKELAAPDGYELSQDITRVDAGDAEDHVIRVSVGNTPTETASRELTVTKSVTNTPANGTAYVEGETVEYEITVKNDTNITVSDIEVKDALTGDAWYIESLAPGEEKTYTTEYTVTKEDAAVGTVVNIATASGVADDGTPVEGNGNEEVTVEPEETTAGPTVTKNAVSTPSNGSSYVAGEEVVYEITVRNDTDGTIGDIEIVDSLTGDSWNIDSLAPGEEETFTTKYTVTNDDITSGMVVNTATVTGVAGDGTSVIGGDSAEVTTTALTEEAMTEAESTGNDNEGESEAEIATETESEIEDESDDGAVETGDNTPIAPVAGLMATALALCLGAFTYRRRKVFR